MAFNKENAKSIKQLIDDQNRLLREQIKIQKESAGQTSESLSDQQDISNVIKDQIQFLKFQRTEKTLLRKLTNDINKISQETFAIGKRQLGVDKVDLDFAKKRVGLEKTIRLLKQQQEKFGKSNNRLDQDIARSIGDQVTEATRLLVEVDRIADSSAKIKDNFGVKTFKTAAEAIGSVPGLKAFDAPFKAASEAALSTSQDIEHALKTGEGLNKSMIKNLGIEKKLQTIAKKDSKKGRVKKGDINQLTGAAAAEKFQKGDMKTGKILGMDRKGIMAFTSGLKAMAKTMMKAFAPVAQVVAFFEAIVAGDKAAGDLAKSMNMTYTEALATRMELTDMAERTVFQGDMQKANAVTTKGLQETLMAVNASLGTGVMLSDEMLVQFTQMRKMAGFTNEELIGIAKISLATGQEMEDITGEFMAQAQMSAVQNGVLLNEKELLKGIKDVSAATTLSFGKNPKLIAEAVATAKSLGMELSKVEGIADSMLDFESSITNELEAELLLNKDINLEKARQAALNNDLATVAKEISEQIGSSAEFSEMNRIQQEALAKSVGMNREDLAQTLFVQEQLAGATAEEAKEREALLNSRIAAVGLEQAQKELAEGGLDTLANQQSQAERLANTIDQLKEVFVSIAEPILAIGLALTPVLEAVGFLVKGIMGISSAIGGALGSINELGIAGKILGGILAVLAAAGAFAALSYIPVVGPALGLAAGAAIMGAYFSAVTDTKKVGDMFSANGRTMVSPAEGGLFELSANDEFAAAPGLGQMLGGGNNTTVAAQSTDMSATNALLEKLVKKTPEMAPLGLYEVQ
jgi:hypothetical protein